ncbi:hypothetical protein ACO1KB_07185 [Leptospira interrogans serovar Szwajizak]|uniref:hypothetical protein n=1 Tax=Leptospira interrogans TaxID=173 RepID=UPI0003480074|nr:hypothetical protein [Leptospira interrogans]
MDSYEPIEVAETKWINHCEDFLRRGWTPKKWVKLPDFIKTPRMEEYYKQLKKRINKNDSGPNT